MQSTSDNFGKCGLIFKCDKLSCVKCDFELKTTTSWVDAAFEKQWLRKQNYGLLSILKTETKLIFSSLHKPKHNRGHTIPALTEPPKPIQSGHPFIGRQNGLAMVTAMLGKKTANSV